MLVQIQIQKVSSQYSERYLASHVRMKRLFLILKEQKVQIYKDERMPRFLRCLV